MRCRLTAPPSAQAHSLWLGALLGAAAFALASCFGAEGTKGPSAGGSSDDGGFANPTILMFVPYHDAWWAEYQVAYRAFRAAGYDVEVRSSGDLIADATYSQDVETGTGPTGHDAFKDLFAANFGAVWNDGWNTIIPIPLDGKIQDVESIADYKALVIAGGEGVLEYRYDGTYAALGDIDHETTAAEVQAAAEKINELINEALTLGIPVAAQCHGATLAAFAREPGTAPAGPDSLGLSVLDGRYATGYPELDGDTAAAYASLSISYLQDEKVVLDGPEPGDIAGVDHARDLIVTSRDWYPQTVALMARTVLNMIESYPTPAQRARTIRVLIYGGDEPDNYAVDYATYDELGALLEADTEFDFDVDLSNNDTDLRLANLAANYDVLLFFGHDELDSFAQAQIRDWVDSGGALVGIHHAIYNHNGGKRTLVEIFGGELPEEAALNDELWIMYAGETNRLINTNLGEFVSSYGTHLIGGPGGSMHYATPNGIPSENQDGDGARGYWYFDIPADDELYLGNAFLLGVSFGRGVNEINRIFSNDRYDVASLNTENGHFDSWGWTRLYDYDEDGTHGRVVYLQPGETIDNTFAYPAYLQSFKNAVVWASAVD
ncbi:MAG: ThuA domain-containing protein [Bdellovibrionales bacterium]|nr:ThuA domain-containing protein [Bdellovibrionales bacterium]